MPITDTGRKEIAEDDELMIEARLVGIIWDSLAIPCCKAANGVRCELVCPHPCSLAEKVIDRFLPDYFNYYARWN